MNILDMPEPGIYLVDKLPSEETCITWSAEKGQVFTSDYHAQWLKNPTNKPIFILQSAWPKIYATRKAVSELTGLDRRDVKCTYPAMARQVGEWLGVDQKATKVPDDFIRNWHYQHCEPVQLQHGYMHDMTAAYWQFASKAPSLLCRINYERETVTWLNMTGKQEGRWNQCKVKLAPFKPLRLAIIGVNSTGLRTGNGNSWYHSGINDVQTGKPPTHFRNLALLTVRSAYEVTQIARKQLAGWYAVADCVLSERDCVPYWDSLGIAYKTKGEGYTECYGIAQWRCGEESTKPYQWKKTLMEQGHKLSLSTTYGIDIPRPVYHEILYA